MEFIGITRLKDGKEVDEFVIGHPEHNYYYSGRPPLTTGCRECWEAFYMGQWVQGGNKPEHVDQLEAAIHHVKESVESGKWDFKPGLSDFEVTHEN